MIRVVVDSFFLYSAAPSGNDVWINLFFLRGHLPRAMHSTFEWFRQGWNLMENCVSYFESEASIFQILRGTLVNHDSRNRESYAPHANLHFHRRFDCCLGIPADLQYDRTRSSKIPSAIWSCFISLIFLTHDFPYPIKRRRVNCVSPANPVELPHRNGRLSLQHWATLAPCYLFPSSFSSLVLYGFSTICVFDLR